MSYAKAAAAQSLEWCFLAVLVTRKLEVKRGLKKVTPRSNGHQQLISNGRGGKLCTKCIRLVSYFLPWLLFFLFTFQIEYRGVRQ